MNELKPCPFCGGKASVNPFIFRLEELPKPIKLFGRWSLIKMRYREIPVRYYAECDDFCDGFAESDLITPSETREEAAEVWNRRAEDGN